MDIRKLLIRRDPASLLQGGIGEDDDLVFMSAETERHAGLIECLRAAEETGKPVALPWSSALWRISATHTLGDPETFYAFGRMADPAEIVTA